MPGFFNCGRRFDGDRPRTKCLAREMNALETIENTEDSIGINLAIWREFQKTELKSFDGKSWDSQNMVSYSAPYLFRRYLDI